MPRLRLARVLLIAVVALGVTAPHAAAAPTDRRLAGTLGALWERVLEEPVATNPFTGGSPCLRLDGPVAPFVPVGTAAVQCTVPHGTKVLVTALSYECSTFEDPPFAGRDEAELRACARRATAGFATPTVMVDGVAVVVREVESRLIRFDAPEDNVFGRPAGPGLSVARGWVVLLPPLSPGRHAIRIQVVGTDVFGTSIDVDSTTTIRVRARR